LAQFFSNKIFFQNLAFFLLDAALFPRKLFLTFVGIKFYVSPGPSPVPDPEPESEYIYVPVLVPLKLKVADPSVPVLDTFHNTAAETPRFFETVAHWGYPWVMT
jgi:hypothetical protein